MYLFYRFMTKSETAHVKCKQANSRKTFSKYSENKRAILSPGSLLSLSFSYYLHERKNGARLFLDAKLLDNQVGPSKCIQVSCAIAVGRS